MNCLVYSLVWCGRHVGLCCAQITFIRNDYGHKYSFSTVLDEDTKNCL